MIIPLNVYAYANRIILGGNTIGIDVKSDGVMIIGFYKVNGEYNRGKPELKQGDYIKKVNGTDISNIKELTSLIEKNINEKKVELLISRNKKEYNITLNLVFSDNLYKTGLFVKDSITGIGTLTYIDPETNIYGALGHEIIESTTSSIIEIKTGTIFRNSITSIDKSVDGTPGSKNAKFYYKTEYGSILKNTKYGIYGNYTSAHDNKDLISVGSNNEIKIGKATIYTVLNEENIEAFDISITKIDEYSDVKNITFKIIDDYLIEETGGIVQGMSGSPIVQNNKIIGAVTHVIVDNPITGYGIFITKMLEEGEK